MASVFKMGRRVNAANKFKAPKRYDNIENETWNSDIHSFRCAPVNKQAIEDEKFLRERQINEENEIQKKRRRKSRGDYDYDNLPEFEIKQKTSKVTREIEQNVDVSPKNASKVNEKLTEFCEEFSRNIDIVPNSTYTVKEKIAELDQESTESVDVSKKAVETKSKKFAEHSQESTKNVDVSKKKFVDSSQESTKNVGVSKKKFAERSQESTKNVDVSKNADETKKKFVDSSQESTKHVDVSKKNVAERSQEFTKNADVSKKTDETKKKFAELIQESMKNVDVSKKKFVELSQESTKNVGVSKSTFAEPVPESGSKIVDVSKNPDEIKKKSAVLRRAPLRRDNDTPKKADHTKTKVVLDFPQKKGKIDYTAILARHRVSSRTGDGTDANADEEESADFGSCETGTEIYGCGENSVSAAATALSTGIGALNLRTTKTVVDEQHDKTAEACSIIAGSQALKKRLSSKSAGRGRNLPSVDYNSESSLSFINILCSTPFQTKHVKSIPEQDEGPLTPPPPVQLEPPVDHVTPPSSTNSAIDHVIQQQQRAVDHVTTPRRASTPPIDDHVTPRISTVGDHVTPRTITLNDHVTRRTATFSDHVTQRSTAAPIHHVTRDTNTPAGHVTTDRTVTHTTVGHVTGENTTAIKHFFETTHHDLDAEQQKKKGGRKRRMDLYDSFMPSPELVVPDPQKFTPGCRRSTRTRIKGFGKLQYERDPETNCLKAVGADKMNVGDLGCFKRYGQLLKPIKFEKCLRGLEKKNFIVKE